MNKRFKMALLGAALLPVLSLIAGCGGSEPEAPVKTTEAPKVTETAAAPAKPKITLQDASDVLDFSTMLPASFTHIADPAAMELSKADMGMGDEASEVELYFSESPFQVIYGYITISENLIERALIDAVFKSDDVLEEMIRSELTTGLTEAEISADAIEINISRPDIGDSAVLGEGMISLDDMDVGIDMIFVKINHVYVSLFSVTADTVGESLLTLAGKCAKNIGNYSQ